MTRGRGWRFVIGAAFGAAAVWGLIKGRRWLRARCRGREHLHERGYRHPRELCDDLAAFWNEPERLRRLWRSSAEQRRLLARLAVVAVKASQCTCLLPAASWLAERLGLSSKEVARLGAGDIATAEVFEVQALLFATQYAEEEGVAEPDQLRELHDTYGDELTQLLRNWLDLVLVFVRTGHTWELGLARLGGAAKGSAVGPLVTIALAVFAGLPLYIWAYLAPTGAHRQEMRPAES